MRYCCLLIFLMSLLGSNTAHGLMQPDNTVIPQGTALQGLFTQKGEMINALNDAAITPETFKPTCKLEFEVLLRLAAFQNSFGWYNATGQKPSLSEHYEFLKCNDPVGTIKTLDIKNDPKYQGGDIGFYQAVGGCGTIQNHEHIVYSEKKYNPDNQQQNPFIHLLIYSSTVTPSSFYFAWEDLLQGGDNDFTDLVTRVTGIQCTGGGSPCQTGQLGICADGTEQCQSGKLQCVPNSVATSESCNGIDDDCDGLTDEGDDLCPADEICDQGNCVPNCGTKEFVCKKGKICSPKGVCVDPSCLNVQCPDGTKCTMGQCVAPCDGVTCPYGQVCRVGLCVDPCKSITCDQGQLCVKGVCQEHCDCIGCESMEVCQMSGECLPQACVGVTCPAGEYCSKDGKCVDACLGAVCPPGQLCATGECVDAPDMSGAGGAGGSPVLAGVGSGGAPSGAGGAGGNDGGANPTTTLVSSGSSSSPPRNQSGACGCHLPGRSEAPRGHGLWLTAVVALGLAGRRLRRRRRPRA